MKDHSGYITRINRLNRQRGGALAYRAGSNFEQLFLLRCQQTGVAASRVPDGCKIVGPNKIIRVKSPFDWIVSYRAQTALLDTKSIALTAFAHSSIQDDQIEEMDAHAKQGVIAGYVICSRKANRTVFAPVNTLLEAKASGRGSIDLSQSLDLNTEPKLIGSDYDFDPRLIFP